VGPPWNLLVSLLWETHPCVSHKKGIYNLIADLQNSIHSVYEIHGWFFMTNVSMLMCHIGRLGLLLNWASMNARLIFASLCNSSKTKLLKLRVLPKMGTFWFYSHFSRIGYKQSNSSSGNPPSSSHNSLWETPGEKLDGPWAAWWVDRPWTFWFLSQMSLRGSYMGSWRQVSGTRVTFVYNLPGWFVSGYGWEELLWANLDMMLWSPQKKAVKSIFITRISR
jgi:hypothetical protein